MRRYCVFILYTVLTVTSYAQIKKTRFPFGSANADSTRVIGISGSLASFGYIDHVTIGLHLELFGLSEMVVNGYEEETPDSNTLVYIRHHKASKRIYGINISGMGFFNRGSDMTGLSINGMASVVRKCNGLAITGLFNYAQLHNGIQVAGLCNAADFLRGVQLSLVANLADYRSTGLQVAVLNKATDHRGLQIGILNRTKKLKGLQLGIWNINGKRKFPLINW